LQPQIFSELQMLIDFRSLRADYQRFRKGKESRHSVSDRINPTLFQYDYLVLKTLKRDIDSLITSLPDSEEQRVALDIGSDKSPYREFLSKKKFKVSTLDVDDGQGAEYVGTAEDTRLSDNSFDLVLCTQVLEHCQDPFRGIDEIQRILKPGGFAIISVPHIWFYHPHPSDYWRFTQEGVLQLCAKGQLVPRVLYAQGGTLLALFQVLNFLVYGVMASWGAPLYFLFNIAGLVFDKAVNNSLFCLNFTCLVQKAED